MKDNLMELLKNSWINAGIPLRTLEVLNRIIGFERRIEVDKPSDHSPRFEEYEIKFRCTDDIFQHLRNIGALYKGGALEKNLIYDDKEMSLHNVDARLRIRTFEDMYSSNNNALITVKKPKPLNTLFGAREFEAEVLLTGDESLNITTIFERAGFHVVSSYERIRHYIYLADLNVKLDVDLFPNIGRFVEAEGKESNVLKAAERLSIDLTQTIPDPYDTIHSDWCIEHKRQEEDHIRFSDEISSLIKSEKDLVSMRRLQNNPLS